ncbi:MAG: hypothetical protein O2894_11385, partial [Planctomycetota bacterium]|nr:hypothetical protein [Planctomycetota bacterium]
MSEPGTPRPSVGDHLRVAWLLVGTVLGIVPFVLFLALSPVLTPWLRARTRRKLQGEPARPAPPPAFDVPASGTVFVVAGEASGDVLGAAVVARLKQDAPHVRVRGYGGPALTAAGAELDEDIVERAVMGFFPVVASLGFWWGLCARTLARLRADPPDLLLTVDFPGLNVRLANWARARGVRTVHFVAPQIWAHTPWRILRWRGAVDRLLATFPYEPALFAGAGIATTFVGHPLFEEPLAPPRGAVDFPERGPACVELWPGSRRKEIDRIAPLLVEAASEVERARPDTHFVVRLAREAHSARFTRAATAARWAPRHMTSVVGREGAPVNLWGALATSGTATAELAVGVVPCVVVYRLGFISWLFSHALVTAPFIALPNLVLGRRAIPERLCFAPDSGERVARDFLRIAGTAEAFARTRADL